MAKNTGRGVRVREYPETTWIKPFRSSGVFAEAKRLGGQFGKKR